jgi:CheY-like chemotaxis protein
LLAEDDPINQFIAIKMLHKLGYQVDAVNNGLEVIEALARKHYDIILMDGQMPGMDGIQTTRQIRIIEGEDRHTIIIAMTAQALQGDHEAFLEAGMDDYVSKPVDYKKLSAVLDGWLNKMYPSGTPCPLPGAPGVAGAEDPVSDDFDMTSFMDRILHDKVLARELIEVYLFEMPNQIEVLELAIKAGDTEQVRKLAHRIRGAALNMCGRNMGEKAAQIENAGKTGELAGLDDKVSGLYRNFLEMKKLMEAGLDYLQSGVRV